jgi:hypothetical protein
LKCEAHARFRARAAEPARDSGRPASIVQGDDGSAPAATSLMANFVLPTHGAIDPDSRCWS